MRKLNRIILHCTATEAGKDFDAQDIDQWHKARGWQEIGYHYVIKLDGEIELGRNINLVGSHVKGHNMDSIGVVYVGGLKGGKAVDTMTNAQHVAFEKLVDSLRVVFGKFIPVHGHNEYDSGKACPSFKVQDKYGYLNQTTWKF